MAEYKQLGLYLREKRLESDLSQAALARSLKKVHVQFVSNWERGLCAPPGHCFEKLIEILRLNREVLVHVMVRDSKSIIEARIYKMKSKKKSG